MRGICTASALRLATLCYGPCHEQAPGRAPAPLRLVTSTTTRARSARPAPSRSRPPRHPLRHQPFPRPFRSRETPRNRPAATRACTPGSAA